MTVSLDGCFCIDILVPGTTAVIGYETSWENRVSSGISLVPELEVSKFTFVFLNLLCFTIRSGFCRFDVSSCFVFFSRAVRFLFPRCVLVALFAMLVSCQLRNLTAGAAGASPIDGLRNSPSEGKKNS